MTGQLRVVVCEPDVHTRRRLRGLRPDTHGAAGFVAPPRDKQSLGDLADALIIGLGKDPVLKVFRADPVAVASAWLTVTGPLEIVVVDAHLIRRGLLQELLNWLDGHGATTVLVGTDPDPHHPTKSVHDFVRHVIDIHGAQQIDEHELDHRWPEAAAPTPASLDPTPAVPLVDGVVFLSTARDLLEQADFAQVEAQFRTSTAAMRNAIASIEAKHPTKIIAGLLRARLEATATTNDFLIEIRAAQAAAFGQNFHIKVDSIAVVAAADRLPRRGRQDPEQWWERLDRYREPTVPATVALFDAELSIDDIADLTIGSIAAPVDGPVTADTADGPIEIREPIAKYVTAQRNFRVFSGAADEDSLFVTHRFPNIKPRYVRRTIERAETDLALRIKPPTGNMRHPDAREWLSHHGIEVTMLDRSTGDAKTGATS